MQISKHIFEILTKKIYYYTKIEFKFLKIHTVKSKILFFVFVIFLCFVLWFFYVTNWKNYEKIKELQMNLVEHPELLPKKEYAKYSSFWFSNLRADIYWLETIQYIGWNAVSSEYKKYLFQILDLITELNPYFEKPYLIWQLLLPNYNDRYEDLSKEEIKDYNKKAEKIWSKWIENFCDMEKVEKIKKEDDLDKIWNDKSYKNPCASFQIPFWQAFVYYFYLKDTLEASNYYKVASAQDDALDWSKVMAAIMKWKWWDREKSILMFLSLAKNADKDKVCENFSTELESLSYYTFQQGNELNGELIKNLESLRNEYFKFDEKDEQKLVLENNCWNYINKAIREFNLYYIEQANKKYFEDKKENAPNAKVLFDEKYLEFLPTDFQQYKDYWIIYEFDRETWNFDYKMGKY